MRVHRETLVQQLQSVEAGLATREHIEQSHCFIFQDGMVKTYNDEVSCIRECDLNITGAIVAQPMLEILSKMKEEELEITDSDSNITILGKGRKGSITKQSEITIPLDVVEKPGKWKQLPADFADAINITHSAAAKKDFKITCVHLCQDWVEATDNIRMVRYHTSVGVSNPILVPSKSIKRVADLGAVKMSQTDNWLHFKSPAGLLISCRKYEDDFPDLSTMLGVEGEKVSLPKGLIDASEAAEVFSKANADENELLITIKDGKIRVKGSGPFGYYRETRKIAYVGNAIEFLVYPEHLREIVENYNECEIGGDKIKVSGGKFTFVSCLGVPNKQEEI